MAVSDPDLEQWIREAAVRDRGRAVRGLVALTHTPNPMGFLGELLGRPAYRKGMLGMPVGYPAPDAQVPDLRRKPLEQIAVRR